MDDWTVPQPVRRVQEHDEQPYDRGRWPATIPAVGRLLGDGLDLDHYRRFLDRPEAYLRHVL